MVRASRTIKVNADPGEPALTRGLVWRGLLMKAENPLPFVPVISSCKIIARHHDGLTREIVDRGDPITERVTFDPERMVTFERLSGRILGTILNEIVEDDDGELALRFTFTLSVPGAREGGDEERQVAADMERGYLMAVASTLNAVRKLIDNKALTTTA
ncbi:MAG: SRPBCC family protein [Xanthobacteraceae bacterium]